MYSLVKVLESDIVLGVYEFRTSTGTSWVSLFFSRETYTRKT